MHPHEVFGTLGCGKVWQMLVAQQSQRLVNACGNDSIVGVGRTHCTFQDALLVHLQSPKLCATPSADWSSSSKYIRIYPEYILYIHIVISYFNAVIVKMNVHEAQTERGHKQGCRSILILKYFHGSLCPGFRAKVFHFRASIVWISHLHGCFRDCLFWRHFVLRAQNEYWHIGVFDAVELAFA